MHDYLVSVESVRLALVLGIIVSTLIYDRWKVFGGASFIAGYMALFFNRPLYLVTTLTLAMVTYYLVQHILAPPMFLYGRRQVVAMVLVGFGLQGILVGLAEWYGHALPWLTGFYGVGFVLPGLVARDMRGQGLLRTALTILGTTLLTYVLWEALEVAKPLFSATSLEPLTAPAVRYAYPVSLFVPAILISLLSSALFFEWTGIRSAGFLTAAHAALFINQPLQLLFMLAATVAVYLVIVHLLLPWTPLFGRTKFAMVVLTAMVIVWSGEVLVMWLTHSAFVPFVGFGVIGTMMVALVANEGERQGLGRALGGLGASTLVVFFAVQLITLFY